MSAPPPKRTMDPPAWLQPWVGLPYADLGRGPAFDCWGLAREIAARQFGLALPSYDGDYTDTAENYRLHELIAVQRSAWRMIAGPAPGRGATRPDGLVRTETEEPGDFLLFRQRRLAGHIAVVAGGGWMVHIEAKMQSCVERYDDQLWAVRLIGIYRHPHKPAVAQ